MLSIPLPFVTSLLLSVLAGCLWFQRQSNIRTAALFVLLCATTTAIVGLRWSFDAAVFRVLQPISASLIPVMAWYVFFQANQSHRFPWRHFIAPSVVTLSAITYPLWTPPLDIFITGMYVAYGGALIHSSLSHQPTPENIQLSDIHWVIKAQRVAGGMLLFSALVDGALTIDFMFWGGEQAVAILSVGHTLLLPALSISVVLISLNTSIDSGAETYALTPDVPLEKPQKEALAHHTRADQITAPETTAQEIEAQQIEAQHIAQSIERIMTEQLLYLEPDLTLARLARKAGIPSRQISHAINQIYHQNVSQFVNRYRIEHAQHLLKTIDLPITQVYMDSGFQTKSNFHREFSRIVGITPTAYRRQLQHGID